MTIEYKVSRFPEGHEPPGGIWKLWRDEQGRRCSRPVADIHDADDVGPLAALLGWRRDSQWSTYATP